MSDDHSVLPDAIADAMVEEFLPPLASVASGSRLQGLMSTTALLAMTFPPIEWVIEGYVTPGVTLLVGRQKLGKTWLAIDWAIAVAVGAWAMGSIECAPGDVLYIDLENGPRRIRERISLFYPDPKTRPDLSRLQWISEAPMLGDDLLRFLDEWMASVTTPKLIIIDVLQRIRPPSKGPGNAYEIDYAALAPLQQWAIDRNIAVVLLHHTRKSESPDPLESVSGSNGLSACADTTIILNKKGDDITLYARGRDVEETDVAMRFHAGRWEAIGNASAAKGSRQREQILAALGESQRALSPGEISDATGMKGPNVRQLLGRMVKDGQIHRAEHGRYSLPPDPGHSDHNVTPPEELN